MYERPAVLTERNALTLVKKLAYNKNISLFIIHSRHDNISFMIHA